MDRNMYGFPSRSRSIVFLRTYFIINVLSFMAGIAFYKVKFGRVCLTLAAIMIVLFALSCAIAVLNDD